MDMLETFAAEISPSLVLLDVQGRRNPVVTADRAEVAILMADGLQEIGGMAKIGFVGEEPQDGAEVPNTLMLYYRSQNGRPTKSEIARAAKVVAESAIRETASPLSEDGRLYVTGRRAVVYPEVAGAKTGAVVFLVSTTVWFNANRGTGNFPAGEAQTQIFLDDINRRLTEGSVSLPR